MAEYSILVARPNEQTQTRKEASQTHHKEKWRQGRRNEKTTGADAAHAGHTTKKEETDFKEKRTQTKIQKTIEADKVQTNTTKNKIK